MQKLSTLAISKNLELITNDRQPPKLANFKIIDPTNKPLVILLSWLLAKNKHIYKFADYYTSHGFDILRVSLTPWQLLWPTKGTQVCLFVTFIMIVLL